MLLLIFSRFGCGKNHTAENSAFQADPLDTFFRNIANTVRTFPQTDIAELKMEISNAVYKREVAISKMPKNDIQYVFTVNPEQSEQFHPIEIEKVQIMDPIENGNNTTSHKFIRLSSGS